MSLVHLHLVLNHFPIVGLVFGFCLLLAGLLRNSALLNRAGLVTLVVCAAFAVPTFLTGEPAEHAVKHAAGVMSGQIESHERAAKVALVAVLVLGVMSLASLATWRRQPAVPVPAVASLLVGVLVAGAALFYAANLGGQIRHPEIASAASASISSPSGERLAPASEPGGGRRARRQESGDTDDD